MRQHNPRSRIDDIDLAATITALMHCRSALVRVIVAVNDGVVTLEGSVASTADSKAAESIARRFAGVRGIENSLTVPADPSEFAESPGDRQASE